MTTFEAAYMMVMCFMIGLVVGAWGASK